MWRLGVLSIPIAVLCVAFPAFGQGVSSATVPPVEYSVTPQAPEPNEPVQITVQGVGSSLGDATLIWQQNGSTVSSGAGDTTFNFTTGSLGSQTTIHLIINSPELGTITNDFTFYPSLTNLVWEAQTTVPQFYRGKALYSGGATVSVIAFPEISINKSFVSSKALSFQWSLNGTLVPTQSGLGRTTFTFQGDQLKNSESVSVDVYAGNTLVGASDIVIPASTPQVVLYDRDPLRGEILDSALSGEVNTGEQGLAVEAEPYYFSNSSKTSGALTYTWTLNGESVTGPDAQKGLLALVPTSGSGTGLATLEVTVQNSSPDQLIQGAIASIQILFGNISGTFPLGL